MTSQVERPNPNDLSYYAPPGLRERAKSISLSQEARSGLQEVRSEPASSSFSHPPSPDVQLNKPLYLRGPLAPEIIHEPDGLVRELRRGALFGVVGRLAAIAAVLTAVALLVGLLLLPASRPSDAGTTSEVTGAITSALPQSSQQENGSKPALAAFQGVLAAPASQPSAPKQPQQQLLQQFLQWREKTNSAETSH
jgi:hypothetical protein